MTVGMLIDLLSAQPDGGWREFWDWVDVFDLKAKNNQPGKGGRASGKAAKAFFGGG